MTYKKKIESRESMDSFCKQKLGPLTESTLVEISTPAFDKVPKPETYKSIYHDDPKNVGHVDNLEVDNHSSDILSKSNPPEEDDDQDKDCNYGWIVVCAGFLTQVTCNSSSWY
jgi:hypothetical protein